MISSCRSHLVQLMTLLSDEEHAYARRTQLLRLVLACQRLLAQRSGDEMPLFPTAPTEASASTAPVSPELAALCAELVEDAGAFCQPSEPLDEAWRVSATALTKKLGRLDHLLEAIDSAAAT